MKTFRMFTEDYVDAYSIHRTSTGPGMGQYVPTADLNASKKKKTKKLRDCLLYTSPSPRDGLLSRMPSSA